MGLDMVVPLHRMVHIILEKRQFLLESPVQPFDFAVGLRMADPLPGHTLHLPDLLLGMFSLLHLPDAH